MTASATPHAQTQPAHEPTAWAGPDTATASAASPSRPVTMDPRIGALNATRTYVRTDPRQQKANSGPAIVAT